MAYKSRFVPKISDDRLIEIAGYISKNRATIRKAASVFGVSKSTLHCSLENRLQSLHPLLYKRYRQETESNDIQKHIRGGESTKKKWDSIRGEMNYVV